MTSKMKKCAALQYSSVPATGHGFGRRVGTRGGEAARNPARMGSARQVEQMRRDGNGRRICGRSSRSFLSGNLTFTSPSLIWRTSTHSVS